MTAEIRVTNPVTGGEKGSKPEQYAWIPTGPLAAVARVYGMGAQKYDKRNWEKGYDWSLSYSALQRHVNAFWGGQDNDPESGEPHLAHAVFHCLALMEWMVTHPELDDRARPSEPQPLDTKVWINIGYTIDRCVITRSHEDDESECGGCDFCE